MHKIWTVDDIKLVIDEIASRWNYPCNIKIEISKRATKRMGAFFYKRNGNNTTFKYFNEENNNKKYKYKIYCSKCRKLVCVHVRKDATIRKVSSYISKCCNARLYCDNLM